jgi:hypothetical protein
MPSNDPMNHFQNHEKYELCSSLSFSQSLAFKSSLETLVQDAFEPVQTDNSFFASKQTKTMLKDTRACLVDLVGTEKDEVVKTSLNRLIKLLDENIELRSVLEIFMDRVKKV